MKSNTAKEVQQLQGSAEFQRYMKLRQDPNSRYYAGNRTYDDVEEIVFSDEEEEEEGRVKVK